MKYFASNASYTITPIKPGEVAPFSQKPSVMVGAMVVVTGALSRDQGERVAELESVSRGSRAGGSRGELAKAHYWQSTPGR